MHSKKIYITIFCLILGVIPIIQGCQSYFAVALAPEKEPLIRNTALKEQAETLFWKTFYSGRYSDIKNTLIPLKAAYLENPNDPDLSLHIAHLHFWRVAERFRMGENQDPNITDDLTIAIKYFIEAKKLNPDDARIDGWLAGARLAESTIHNDEKDKRLAYYQGLESIKSYPEFNYFSMGYLFSNIEYDDTKFTDAIDWYFKSMDLAYHTSIDRVNPDVTPYLYLEDKEDNEKLKRAVWNTSIAPHNLEGFYLNFGDFLVKNGRVEQAKIIYKNAQLVSSYSKWPFKHILEDRLLNIDTNIYSFRASQIDMNNKEDVIYKNMIFNSYNCMVCHQVE